MDKPPPIDPALVRAFVASAHGDFDKVKTLLSQEPGLLHSSWDWGGGDWEDALGAAAHVGRRDIANFLIERDARLDVFAAAMLGKLSTVRALLEAQPALREAKGPHGIGLMAHAEAGGEAAKPVVALLQSRQSTAG